jgi:hypothetical protein
MDETTCEKLNSRQCFERARLQACRKWPENAGLYRLRKNYQMAEVLKGHGFSRAASG